PTPTLASRVMQRRIDLAASVHIPRGRADGRAGVFSNSGERHDFAGTAATHPQRAADGRHRPPPRRPGPAGENHRGLLPLPLPPLRRAQRHRQSQDQPRPLLLLAETPTTSTCSSTSATTSAPPSPCSKNGSTAINPNNSKGKIIPRRSPESDRPK